MQNKLTFISATKISILYEDPKWDKNKMYVAMLEDFIQMIEKKTHTCVSFSEAIKTVSLIEKINKKSSNSRDVE